MVFAELHVVLFEFLQLFFIILLCAHHLVVGLSDCTEEFVEFEMHGHCITVLAVLNQEDHQERDDGGAGVDDELPCARESKEWSCGSPDDDEQDRCKKGEIVAGPMCSAGSEMGE